ncbi:hypothetical protein KKB18_00995, partial [bacterium]|nr:hypothetical protein [bacterium]
FFFRASVFFSYEARKKTIIEANNNPPLIGKTGCFSRPDPKQDVFVSGNKGASFESEIVS